MNAQRHNRLLYTSIEMYSSCNQILRYTSEPWPKYSPHHIIHINTSLKHNAHRTMCSTQPSPKLSPQGRRHSNAPNGVIIVHTSRIHVSLKRLNEACAHHDLVTDVEKDEKNHAYICNEERSGIPRDERRKTLREDDKDIEKQSVPRKEWLPHRLVWKCITRDVADSQSAHEGDMATVNACPSNETRNGSDVEQPVEHSTSVGGEVQEGKQANSGGDSHRNIWHTTFGGPSQESWCRALTCETNQNSASRIDVGVRGGQDDEEKDGVDEAWKDLDTGQMCRNDKRRSTSIRSAGQEVLVIIGNEESDEEHGEDEEEQDSVEGLLDGRGDVLTWVFCLAGGNTDEFRPLVGESSLDQDGPETDKFR